VQDRVEEEADGSRIWWSKVEWKPRGISRKEEEDGEHEGARRRIDEARQHRVGEAAQFCIGEAPEHAYAIGGRPL
jgi:hypothetical protein